MKKVIVLVVALLLVSWVTYGASSWQYGTDKINSYPVATTKLGIGTTTPLSKLHVEWSSAGPTAEENRSAIYGYNTSTDVTYANSIGLYGRVKTSKGVAIYGFSENSNGYAGYFRGGLGITADGYNKIWRIDEDSNDDLLLRFTSNGGSSWNNILKILDNGNVGIGTTDPGSYKLAVNGTIRAKEIKVETGWSDFVFADNYQLMPLDKLADYINVNKSLPGIPKEKEVAENGVNLGEMQAKLLAKVEELTLYVIELKKENEELKNRISALEK